MRALRRTASHETLNMQRNAVLAEELADFRVGQSVMTVDGFPGKVSAVDFGPYQNTEEYQVILDGGMGGGTYTSGQLRPMSATTASIKESVDISASIPFEAVTDHTANMDYPELENILTDRLPNENIKVYASRTAANNTALDDNDDDESDKLDQQSNDTDDSADVQKPNVDDDAAEEDAELATGPGGAPNVTPPSACSFCGSTNFEEPQMTGRGTRIRCEDCGGTMKSWGGKWQDDEGTPQTGPQVAQGQWEPEFPNSSQNNASERGDDRSGGVGGVAALPDSNYKVASLETSAGLINWFIDKVYDRILERQQQALQGKDWAAPADLNGQQGPANYIAQNAQYPLHPQMLHPNGLTIHSSLEDSEWGFHVTASWLDVQAKARKIRAEGHVRIVEASGSYCVGEVQGDNNVYETQLNYVIGSKKVADWACGCKWASYSWGRSKPFRRFEGRLCSHALALQYEAGARGMFGKEVNPDKERPAWQEKGSPIVVQHDKGQQSDLARFSSLLLDSDGVYPEPQLLDLAHMPLYAFAVNMLDHDEPVSEVVQMFASFGVDREEARAMTHEAFAEPASDEPESHAKRSLAAGWTTDISDGLEDRTGSSSVNEQLWDQNAQKRDLSDHDNDDPTNPHKKHHHRTNDARENAPHNIHNYSLGLAGWLTCGQCNGSGCGRCAGQGIVPPEVAATSTQPLTDQTPDETDQSGSGVTGDGVSASLHTGAYNVGSPFPDDGTAGGYVAPTPSSHSANPASTGWATSQDPGDWGRSLISNNFGVTFDASLHTTALASSPLEGPTVSGVALKAHDTGRVLMIQRSMKDDKDRAKGTWEFPGGHHEEGDATSLHAGIREWQEEVGQPFPQGGHVTHVHRSGPYNLHTIVIPQESAVDFSQGRSHDNPDDPDGDDHEQAAWWDPEHARKNPALRSELKGAPSWGDIKKAAHLGEQQDHRTPDEINEDNEEKITEPKQVMRASLETDDVTQEDLDSVLGVYTEYKESTLHDEPEGALPTTDGFAPDAPQEDTDDILAGNSVDGMHVGGGDAESIRMAFLQSKGALMIADGDSNLVRTAMKDFNHAEQQELINEGIGDRARNFGDLKIAGTHYEQLPDEQDDWFS